jgi:hypothetical protein
VADGSNKGEQRDVRRSSSNLRTVVDGSDKGEPMVPTRRTERCDEDANLAPESARNMMAWWMGGAPPIYQNIGIWLKIEWVPCSALKF